MLFCPFYQFAVYTQSAVFAQCHSATVFSFREECVLDLREFSCLYIKEVYGVVSVHCHDITIPGDHKSWKEGEFCMGHFMEGQVLKRLYTGCIYEGEYEYPDILCGGILRYPDGRAYTGDYDEVYPHGQGKMTYPDGAYFTGSFVRNVAHGKGVFNFPDGSSEEAEFINGRLIAGGARTLALLKLQPEDLITGPLPCLTVKREYSTFGGGQFGIYRFPVRVGVIPFTDMVMLEATEGAAGKFEITAVTDDSVSFVVPGEYFADKLPQIHTLSLAGEKKVFEHIEEGWATIYETVHDYETLHRITVSTDKGRF